MKRLIPAVLVLPCLTACGTEPPSKDDLVSQLVDGGAADGNTADCVADVLLDADLSGDQLNAVDEGDDSSLNSEDLDDLDDALEDARDECGPTKEEVAMSLVENADLEQDQADCVADAMHAADLSVAQLDAVARDEDADLSEDDKSEVGEVLGEALVDCISF